MDIKLITLLACTCVLLLWGSIGCAGQDVSRHVPPIDVPTFRRDSVEHVPQELFRRLSDYTSLDSVKNFGSKSLPLRTAVESVPQFEQRRLPLRDAVERRLVPEQQDLLEYDVDTELLDIDLGFRSWVPPKTPFSPYVRFWDEVLGIPPPFRVDNPYQRVVDVSNAPRHEYQYRRGRQLDTADADGYIKRYERYQSEPVTSLLPSWGRLAIGNKNLNEKYQTITTAKIMDKVERTRIVCYVEEIAIYRKEPLAFSIQDLDPYACTHLLYAFATVDPHNYAVIPRDHEYDIVKGGFRSATGLKQLNPNLKVLISIGGDQEESSRRYSQMVATPSRRRDFIRSVIAFLQEFDFDGVDLHWTYPGAEELGGETSDKENFGALVEELKEVFKPRDYILSVAVPGSRFRIEDGFDVNVISHVVDFINLQAFDMHNERGSSVADHHSPIMRRERDRNSLEAFLNVDYSVRYWLKKGMPRSKINLGVPFYGRSFTLRQTANGTTLGATTRGPGKPGYYTQTPGILAYYEICDQIINEGWDINRDSVGSPYAYMGDQWVGFDDPLSIEKKMQYIRDMGLGGASVWALDMDDFRGLCGDKYPLLSTVRRSLSAKLPGALPLVKIPLPLSVHGGSGRCDKNGLYSDPRDCAAYYVCHSGHSYRVKCKAGHMFDILKGRCDTGVSVDRCRPGVSVYVVGPADSFKTRPYNAKLSQTKQDKKKVVCYLTNWAFYRKAEGKFVPEHLDQRLCTHIVWAFASLEPDQLMIKEFDPWADLDNNLYQRVTSIPDSSVLLALGGWTDSNGDKFSRLVSDGSARRRFVISAVSFLRRHGFKGLHLDWNYPVCWQSNCGKGPKSDKPNFTKLIQELRAEFDKENPKLLLAAAISGYKEVIDVAYELDKLGKELDFVSVMTYDYHGAWERKTGHVSPLYHRNGDKYMQYNTNYTMEYLVQNGAPRSKLLMGVPFYGQSFTLPYSSGSKDQGVSAQGPGEPGEFTRQPGMLAYYEICNRIKSQHWTVMQDPQKATGPYTYHKDQWVGYDDVTSIRNKAEYIVNQGFGGAVSWTVDLDDFSNRCCRETFPLLKSLNRGLGLLKDSAPPEGDCTKPPEPVTPPAPTLTTGVDSGAAATQSTTSWPQWKPSTTTTKKPSTWWSSTTTEATTTSPWWTTTQRTTTEKPTTTERTTTERTTTERVTTTRTTTEKRPETTTERMEATTIPVPAVVMPANDPVPGPACETGTYLPDPHNCNAYYRCVLGELKKQYCAGGLHWNKDKLACDWPAMAKCEEKPEKPSSTTSRPKKPTHKPHSTTTRRPTTTTESGQAEEKCVNGMYYPHEYCDHFYVCVNGWKVQQRCGPGLQWNVEKGSCDWAFKVDCKHHRSVPQKTQQQTQYHRPMWYYSITAPLIVKVQPYSPCEEGAFAPYPGACNMYMQCLWGKYETYHCAPGLHWNANKNTCDWPAVAKCTIIQSEDDNVINNAEATTRPPAQQPQWTPPPTTTTTTTMPTPSTTTVEPEPLSGYFKIVCYFTNWAWYRRGIGKYTPEHIDHNLCTHIVYGFAVLDYEKLTIKAHDSWADYDNKFYERVVAYKAKGLKVSLALGGWNDSAGDKYSRLVNNPSARERFIKHALEFLEKYNFDGLDLDWEYPKCWQVDCKKGPDSDKAAFAAFVTEIKQAFAPKGLLLSSAVSPSKTVIDAGYDVPALAKNLDWVAVMTYDFHGQWDKQTGHVAPLYYHPDDAVTFYNANFSINYWISEGVPRRKIVMGMPLYGQSFQLEKAANNGLNAKAPGPGQAGEFTRAAGFLAYYEICDRVKNRDWTVVQDPEKRMGPYAYKGNQWVSFDDAAMIRQKSEYIRAMDLGGGMIWALDLDDFRNRCGEGNHPLLSVIREVLREEGTGVVTLPTSPVVASMEDETPAKPAGEKPDMEDGKPDMSKPDMGKPGGQKPDMSKPATKRPESMKPEMEAEQPKPDEPMVETGTVTSADTGDEFKVVCYFTNWAWYRQGGGKYVPGDIDPELCTHIVYGFAVLNGDRLLIKPHDTWADYDNKFYEKVTALRSKGVKVLIAIGGWNDSAGDKYSRLVNNPSARRKFIAHVVDFIQTNGFDGLDLDWEYPKCWQVDCNKGPESDKAAFASFVKELREAFRPKNWLLSAAVSPSKRVVDAGYDVPVLSEYLDWIAVMCYDYHGQWDKITGHVAPMYVHDEDVDVTFNANFTIHYWIERGADRKKIVMGMPMYGQSFSLADNNKNGLNSPTYGGGEAGEATRARGFLSYYEICANIQKKGWQVVHDPKGRMGPYAYLRDQWVSFDDQPMIQHKSEYIKAMGLGGGMIWALDLDDFKNTCGCEPYPLLRTINRILRGYNKPQPECVLESKAKKTPMKKPLISVPGFRKPCNGERFVPDEKDCNKYYLCNQGELIEQRCPSGLHWNVDKCDWPQKSGCTSTETTTVAVATTSVSHDELPVEEGPTTTVKPVYDGTGFKTVCYFTNWAWYRQGDGKYLPSDIDPNLCTHINYGFAVLDSSTLTIKPHDSWADIDNEFYRKVTDLKKKGIKVLIALGGWNDSLGNKYSRLVNDPQARARFIKHVIEFIEKWNFDGLDLDWEYPKCWQVDCAKGPDSDKQAFTALVRELSQAFKPKGLLLSSAVSPSKTVIDAGYEVAELAKYFDWIAVMTYDFHGHWDKKTGHVAPLYYFPGDTYDYFNANFSLNYWIEKGAPPSKIVMGMPLYGQSFSLADASNKGLNSPAYGPGEAGEFTRAGGFLAFYEICDRVKKRGWTTVRDSKGRMGPYAHSGTQWVGYDDVSEIVRKAKLVKQLNLGGGMIWALDLDDFRNRCGCGKHPLLKALNHVLRGTPIDTALTDCT